MTILGIHASRSPLKYLANKKASSLIKVSKVCFSPHLILGISTLASKRRLSSSVSSLVLSGFKTCLFPARWSWTVNGTITNIGDKPIEKVYVYLILRNPDGSADFRTYDYDLIENLYMGESETFEFTWITIEEGQTVEIFLVY